MGKLILIDELQTEESLAVLENLGLGQYVIDFNEMRRIYAAPIYKEDGSRGITEMFDKKLIGIVIDMFKGRLERGELTVISNFALGKVKLKRFTSLIKKYDLTLILVTYQKELKIHSKCFQLVPKNLEALLKPKPLDFSRYKKIHHFGDIQGCFGPLNDYFAKNGVKQDEAYVFLGDMLDRGTQNAEVMEFVLKHRNAQNFYFLFGNHEAHLKRWVANKRSNSMEFETKTKKQLEERQISKLETKEWLRKLTHYLHYEMGKFDVIASHAGIPKMPNVLDEFSLNQWVWGATKNLDELFEKNLGANKNLFQIHGHSNTHNADIDEYEHSLNLEGKIEENNILRVACLTDKGFEFIYQKPTAN